MRLETIDWQLLPKDGMPDAATTVLISTDDAGVNSGWFDGEHWRWCESGGIVGEPVLAWADLPFGITSANVNSNQSSSGMSSR
ncbi:hypothetical protein ACFJGW_00735 [Burkholderiaceae bacterium UC74_6]